MARSILSLYKNKEIIMRIPTADNKGTVPGRYVENINFLIVEPLCDKDWSKWASDQVQAGLGDAIKGLISGLFIGLGTTLIQTATEKIRGSTPSTVEPDTESQILKIAILTEDCDTLFETSGNVKKAVFEMLAKAQNNEPNNYTRYLSGVATCKHQRMKTPQK